MRNKLSYRHAIYLFFTILALSLQFNLACAEKLRDLYPKIEPYRTGYLQVSPLHRIYYEESGNPNGKPVVFLHGGPGGGTWSGDRRFFDPKAYRIVLFDQRGSGKSTPLGELRDNTVPLLVEDIETLRKFLNIDKWMVFGGSFGSALALAYAEEHPDSVTEMVLRGIFLGTEEENLWVSEEGGVGHLYPDLWEDYVAIVPKQNQDHLLKFYYDKIRSKDLMEQKKAALEWENYQSRLTYEITPPRWEINVVDEQFIASALIETEYFTHHLFLKDDQLIKRVNRIRQIPSVIVQGRHDFLCPLWVAYRLHTAWPEAKFIITEGAAHSSMDAPNRDQLIRATDMFRPSA